MQLGVNCLAWRSQKSHLSPSTVIPLLVAQAQDTLARSVYDIDISDRITEQYSKTYLVVSHSANI